MERYTAAIIGTGRIGFLLGFDKKREQPACHTKALNGNRRIDLCAACDTDRERLDLWKKYNRKARVYDSASELFATEKKLFGKIPDIIDVAVNENAHHKISLEAIEQKPRLVILEKPVALNTAEAQEILYAANSNGVNVLVNHERRFAKDYRLAKKLMAEIGEIQSIVASLHSSLRVYSAADEDTGAYSLLHDGTHLVDVVRFLLEDENTSGDFLHDFVLSGFYADEKRVVRNVCAHYRCDKCPDVTFNISGRSKFFGFEIDILGTLGRIKIGNGLFEFYKSKPSKLYSGFKSLACEQKSFKGKTGYFSEMVQNAVDFLDGNAPLYSTVEDGLETLKILEQIKRGICERL